MWNKEENTEEAPKRDEKPLVNRNNEDGLGKDAQSASSSKDSNGVEQVEAAVEAKGNDPEVAAAAAKTEDKTTSVSNVAAIPDGGLSSWLQVLGSFFLFFNSWGITNTYGVYQTYYQSYLLRNNSPSSIAWIGSVQAFLLLFVGTLAGPMYDAGYLRIIMAVGSFLIVFGHMMLSLCEEYWEVLLAQAFCIGLGPGLLVVPSVAILSTYFRKKLAFSIGIAATGSSLGGVLYPIMLSRLISETGFPWAVRIIGFVCLATLLIPNAVIKMRVVPETMRSLIDWSAFRDVPFLLFTLASFIGFMGLYMPFVYVESFAIVEGIADEDLAFYLLSILNAASTFGRAIPNFIAGKIGPFNVFIPATVVSGVLILCLIPVSSLATTIVICALFGFTSGAFVSIPATIVVMLTPNRGYIGTRMGMAFGFAAIGILIGSPIGGAVLKSGGYNAIWIWGGVLMLSSGLLYIVTRIAKFGWKPIQRVLPRSMKVICRATNLSTEDEDHDSDRDRPRSLGCEIGRDSLVRFAPRASNEQRKTHAGDAELLVAQRGLS
ncbi:major facilitator superfamily domain-containing protein [Lineolata rhizophorae]|uniref:Major facilitator superfamily domain-containing protein n=1 Tax=Lineolata rhizophorae TaxID=578093 RepID=A0A6A6P0T5_9PEZI|nr:major facilitator superfamily domain-containing protein [Lineolata rhizophorae]